MSITVDQLEVQIKSDSTSAVGSIDALASSLNRLKSATKGGVGLRTVASQVSSLNTALSSVDSSGVSRLDSLANALQKLSTLGKISLNKSLSTNITSLGVAVSSLKGVDFTAVNGMSQAMQSLSSIQKSSGLASLSKNITAFGTAVSSLDVKSLTTQINQLNSALTPLASNLSTVATAMKTFNQNAKTTATVATQVNAATSTMGTGYMNLWAKLNLAITGLRSASRGIASLVSSANDYIEDVNLFNVAMGNYASEAGAYAEKVSSVMGIDPGEWIRNQSVFQTIIEGFGNSSDAAYKMSKNLTQLGYDMSSFFNISYEDAFQKLQSGISGELEPLRRLGYDLSVARLQQEAYSMGITKSVSSMTQAEKSMLRYRAIMTQVTTAQGDMARTLSAPSNQLRVLRSEITMCARAWGQLFIPILSAVLPYAIAVARVLRTIAGILASLFGIKLPSFSSDIGSVGVSLGDAADGAAGTADGLGDAAKNAKKMKDYLLGIDELNVISPDTGSSGSGSSGSGGSGGGGGVGDLDIPEYDFLNGVSDQIQDLVDKMLKWLGLDDVKSWFDFWDSRLGQILEYAMAIGAALAAWKIAKGLRNFMDWISGLKGFSAPFFTVGLLGMLSDIAEFKRYLDDFLKYGPTFQNVVGMISEFAGMLGDAFLMLGNVKIGGALKIVQGLGEIAVAVKGFIDEGVNWDDALTAVRGISNLMIGIGALTGNVGLSAVGLTLQGAVGVLRQLDEIMEAVRTGDWSGVDKISLAINAAEMLGGLFLALSNIKVGDATVLATIGSSIGSLFSSIGTGIATAFTGSALYAGIQDAILGMAIAVGSDSVAVGAALLSGAVAGVVAGIGTFAYGVWDALKNGLDIINGMLIPAGSAGAGAAIGAIIGSLGGPIGTGIGALIGLIVGLVTDGILLLREHWDDVVAFFTETIPAWWTGTVIPFFQQIPTWFSELWNNVITFFAGIPAKVGEIINSIIMWFSTLPGQIGYALGYALGTIVSWAQNVYNTLTTQIPIIISNVVAWFQALPGKIYTAISTTVQKVITWGSNVLSTFKQKVTLIITSVKQWFSQLPTKIYNAIKGAVTKIVTWANDMINKIKTEVPKIINAIMKFFNELPQKIYDLGTDIINGLINGLKDAWSALKGGISDFCDGFVQGFKDALGIASPSKEMMTVGDFSTQGLIEGVQMQQELLRTTMVTMANNVKSWFSGTGGENITTKFTQFGTDVVNGFKNQISAYYSTAQTAMTNWATSIKTWFSNIASNKAFGTFATQVINGFKNKISTTYTTARSVMTTFATSVVDWFKKPDGESIVDKFFNIGKNIIQGFIDGVNSLWDAAMNKIKSFGESIISKGKEGTQEHSPSKAFREIGAFVIEGFDLGLESVIPQSYAIMDDWLKNICSYQPSVSAGFSVDTSAFDFADSEEFFGVSGSVTHSAQVAVDGYKEGMGEFYDEYMKPLMSQMAEDMRRQADKKEQTIVKIGNRTVSDAVVTQKNANGYRFVTEG